jgi:hypothetical protein
VAGDAPDGARDERGVRKGCVGCLTVVAGFFSGAMVGVFVSKMVQVVTNGPRCADIPTCDWHVYAGWGALVGLVTLPLLTFRRLRRLDAGAGSSDRG